jgi:hypothetical protein
MLGPHCTQAEPGIVFRRAARESGSHMVIDRRLHMVVEAPVNGV